MQRLFIVELARRAGYDLDFDGITSQEMIIASDRAFNHDYEKLEEIIRKSLVPRKEKNE